MASPRILATLPAPFDPLHGRIQASEVQSVQRSRKRKRFEVSAAVDGEGISVHSLQTPRLLTSYAVPPHSRFLTSPQSIVQRRDAKKPLKRFTYAAVQRDVLQPKVEVVAFVEEEHQRGPNAAANQLLEFRYQIDDPSIHSIEVIADTRLSDAHDATHSILVVYKHGKVQCLSADLQTTRWTAYASTLDQQGNVSTASRSNWQVDTTLLTDAGTASTGILRDRPDVLSAIGHPDPRLESLEAIPLLFILARVSRRKSVSGNRALHVFAMNSRAVDSAFASDSTGPITLSPLTSWKLPDLDQHNLDQNTSPEYRFDASSAKLFERNEFLTIYDMAGLIPRAISTFRTLQPPRDMLPVSSSLLMVASDKSCTIYDTKFSSVHTSFSCELETCPGYEVQKQKAASSSNLNHSPAFICHFPDTDLTVALQENTLIGFQVNPDTNLLKRKRASTRLIDSIQKGVGLGISHLPYSKHNGLYPLILPTSGTTNSIDDTWRDRIEELNACVDANNVDRFEELLLESGNSMSSKGKLTVQDHGFHNPAVNGYVNDGPKPDASSAHANVANNFQNTSKSRANPLTFEVMDSQRAKYVLSKIFSLVESDGTELPHQYLQSTLHIKFFPPNVFRHVVVGGHMTLRILEQSFSDKDPPHQMSRQFEISDVVKAIFNFDPTGELLHTYLSLPTHLDIFEILEAIRALIFSPKGQGLLTLEEAQHAEESGGKDIIAQRNSINNETSESKIKQALAIAISRLSSFPSTRIAQAIHATMTVQEAKAIIITLRQQLFDGGWLTFYIDQQLEDSKQQTSAKTSLIIITQLLNCAIDAVGLSGWLVSHDVQESSKNLLSELRKEASMALESIHEMQSLRDILTEFSKAGPSFTPSSQVTGYNKHPFTVPSSPELPLGRDEGKEVSSLKIGAGGRVKQRSKREIGHELNKRVGEYSIERIRF
ncbi:hypothetical protein EV356DRAFT_563626 [Viridothelium virens]|uniref:Utp8 beta-propeller domain-containing protein n=1 Tax=Viridothelium virens TaxID=1048519 RepID=A0A6A6HM64_VIRVR|nr:hypothetical protein EV356DRAFT_563626 [Viridothelium virens]